MLLAMTVCAVEIGLRVQRVRSGLETGALSPEAVSQQVVEPSRSTFLDVKPLARVLLRDQQQAERFVETNEWGCRNPSLTVPKPNGVYRVLCLGGSETFAPEFDVASTFVAQSESLLGSQTELKVEVINAGCPQAGPLVHLLRLRHRLAGLQPDLIVVVMTPEQLQNDARVRPVLRLDDTGHAAYAIHPQLDPGRASAGRTICQEFVVFQELAKRSAMLWPGAAANGAGERAAAVVRGDPLEDDLLRRPFDDLRSFAQGIYSNLMFVECPTVWDLSSDLDAELVGIEGESTLPRSRIQQLVSLDESGETPLLSANELLRRAPDVRNLFSKETGRLSAEGHTHLARQLAAFIVQKFPGIWTSGVRAGSEPGGSRYNHGSDCTAQKPLQFDCGQQGHVVSELTKILHAVNGGDRSAADQLFTLVYEELHRLASAQLARERADHTLQPTALVHEVYLRLFASESWENRRHFFGAAAVSIRRILIENARAKQALKRGGGEPRRSIDEVNLPAELPEPPEDLLALDEALKKFADEDPQAARLVELRYFTGLTLEDAAGMLEVSPRTAGRLWTFARAWLRREIEGREAENEKK
ncbi:Sigma-70 family RNA polymerase sigma factor [Durusdinium trenchii]|uniref:Sigma-70 family RNA polymerase sigma factor n=1 Tax=Durusdinium trenchii TaxID=1381693 RepID=A0ABP0PA19_9DINO